MEFYNTLLNKLNNNLDEDLYRDLFETTFNNFNNFNNFSQIKLSLTTDVDNFNINIADICKIEFFMGVQLIVRVSTFNK